MKPISSLDSSDFLTLVMSFIVPSSVVCVLHVPPQNPWDNTMCNSQIWAKIQVYTLWTHFLVTFVASLQLITGMAHHHSCVEESFIWATVTLTRSYLVVHLFWIFMKTLLLYTFISKNHLAINDEKQTTMKYIDDTSTHIFSPLKNRSINSQQYQKLFGIPPIIALLRHNVVYIFCKNDYIVAM